MSLVEANQSAGVTGTDLVFIVVERDHLTELGRVVLGHLKVKRLALREIKQRTVLWRYGRFVEIVKVG